MGGGRDALAQQPPQWGDMESGPHAVGFRVIRGYDHTRSYWPPVGYDGKRDTLETARPMQISVWYPAADSVSRTRMAFGEHVALEGRVLGILILLVLIAELVVVEVGTQHLVAHAAYTFANA